MGGEGSRGKGELKGRRGEEGGDGEEIYRTEGKRGVEVRQGGGGREVEGKGEGLRRREGREGKGGDTGVRVNERRM